MKNWLYEKSTVVFCLTLAIYVLIWCTVSYIGVYVTYVSGPLLLISGVTAWLSSPKSSTANE
jgi:hypothetical protein